MASEVSEKKRAEQRMHLLNLLRKIPLFQDLNTTVLRMILAICTKVSLKKGGVLCKKGNESTAMFILLVGKLSVMIDRDKPPIATIEPVSSIGEMGVFTGETRSATVVAEEDSALLVVQRSDLNALIRRNPEFGVKIMRKVISILSERIAADNIKLQEYQQSIISSEEEDEARDIAAAIEDNRSIGEQDGEAPDDAAGPDDENDGGYEL